MLWSEDTNTNRHQCEGEGGVASCCGQRRPTLTGISVRGGGGSIMLWSEETNTNRHQCEGGAASCCGQRRPTLTGISVRGRGRGRQHHAVVSEDQH
uniref:Uncharacterized protein n=1 Tax=Knipowitschia caucasica TaxID=637954 RepID=A0AAV2J4F4_KNICA